VSGAGVFDAAREELSGSPGGGINMGWVAADRYAASTGGAQTALICFDRRGTRTEVTYAKLAEGSNRFASALEGLGVLAGERVFILMPRGADLVLAVVGALKHRCVVCCLFPTFGPEPLLRRLEIGDARVLVTTPGLYSDRVAPYVARLPGLRHVLLAGAGTVDTTGTSTHDLHSLLQAQDGYYDIGATEPDRWALLHFTSGTTGYPKGAVHVHDAVVWHYSSAGTGLDLHPGDVYWCTADPGWVTGVSYGIIAPLSIGATCVLDGGDFDSRAWYGRLESEKVAVWYTSPTALRMLMRSGGRPRPDFDLSRLRLVASVGETLDPELILRARLALGTTVHDTWWQTETGGIMVANYGSAAVRPGSLGRALPGIEAAVLVRDRRGRVARTVDGHAIEAPVGAEGELAIRPGWPSMFRAYLGDADRYRASFAGGWYLSGDIVHSDADGYFWFAGRSDDMINSAGHLIGPAEVESVLVTHPAVAEVGAIGKPDAVAGEIVKAFVVLGDGYEPGEDLMLDILAFARRRLGPAVAPREIAFAAQLPHNRSGKIIRAELRRREADTR